MSLRLLLASCLVAAAIASATPATAQGAPPAAGAKTLVQSAVAGLARIANASPNDAERKAQLQVLVDRDVDVDGIAQFSLGRYWATATPQQRQQFDALFHAVIVNNISSKLGSYTGVSFAVGEPVPQGELVNVATTATWPAHSPSAVGWLVGTAGTQAKIVDVVVQGTSLRQTQRSDYAAYLGRNNGDVDALIRAMRQQVGL